MNSTCPDGWARHPMRTASAECPVRTQLLVSVCTVGAVVGGVCSIGFVALVRMVRRGGGAPWSSAARTRAYTSFALGCVTLSAAMALLGADVRVELAAPPGAPWRVLYFVSLLLLFAIPGSSIFWDVMFEPAAQFVGTLDAARWRTLALAGKGGQAGCSLCLFGLAVPGKAMSLFGTSTGTQEVGAVLEICGYMVALVTTGTACMFAAHELARLARELGPTSSSGKQVTSLRQSMRCYSWVCFVVALVVAMFALARVHTGALVLIVYTIVPAIMNALFFYLEGTRLDPFRASAQRRRASVQAAKVSPAQHTVAAFAATAQREFAQDSARLQLLLAQERQPAGVPRNGVSLQLLRDFVDAFGIDNGQTTAGDVCARHVKPTTQDTTCALATVLQGGRDGAGRLWCDKPTHFISYAWSYSFLLLVDILEGFEEEQPPPPGTNNYYFLDQFSLNQHTFVTEDANQKEMQERVLTTLEGQMLKSGHVLMCLHPWNRPIPLSRAWCLFELYVALESKCQISMCFGREDAAALFAAAQNRTFTAADAVGEIDAANADATEASDKELIVRLIQDTMGLERFNATMQGYLLKSFQAAVTGELARAYSAPAHGTAALATL